jgi:hypothetical protein
VFLFLKTAKQQLLTQLTVGRIAAGFTAQLVRLCAIAERLVFLQKMLRTDRKEKMRKV